MTSSSAQPTTPPLPRPLTRFIGREDEIESLVHLLQRHDVRLVTLTGTGGIGKTRLSIEIAHRFADTDDWDVGFVSLATTGSPPEALPKIGEALGLWNTQPDDVVPRIATLVANRPVLLVIDNLEHVIDLAPDIASLLASTTELTVLATSRSPLHIQGEREYSVPQLTTPDPDNAHHSETLLASEAVALFIDRACAVSHDFEPDRDEIYAIARICNQLDGLPLAIELAAARTRTLTPTALLSRLDNQLSLLRSEARDLPDRLRTIRATIDWSYRLLAPEEQQAFRRISVFAGDFPLSAATAVLQTNETEALDMVESLIDKSLLLNREPFKDEPHFRMLAVVRQFGLELLEQSGELEAVRARQAEWAANIAEDMFRRQFGPEQGEAFREISRVHETIRQSLLWSMEQEEWDIAARIGANLWQYWDLFGYLGQGRQWLRRIIEQDRDWPIDLIPNLYYGFAILAGSADDTEENRRVGESLLERHRTSDDPRLRAIALNVIGLCLKPEPALRASEEAASIWNETGDTIWHGLALGLAGRWARQLGDLARSEEYSRQSYEVLRDAGHVWGAALALLGVGRVYQLRGDTIRAEQLYQQGLVDLASIGDRILVLRFVEFMTEIAAERDEWERAIRLSAASARMREAMGYELRYQAEAEAFGQFLASAREQLGDDLFNAAWAVGQRYTLDQTITEARSLPASVQQAMHSQSDRPAGMLTRRERDVLRLVVKGKTDQAIADELFVSYRTVTTHVTNILNKLGANSRTEAAAIAVREQLI